MDRMATILTLVLIFNCQLLKCSYYEHYCTFPSDVGFFFVSSSSLNGLIFKSWSSYFRQYCMDATGFSLRRLLWHLLQASKSGENVCVHACFHYVVNVPVTVVSVLATASAVSVVLLELRSTVLAIARLVCHWSHVCTAIMQLTAQIFGSAW